MRIDGYFRGNSPFLLLSVKSKRPKIRRKINFLIDTGSDVTGISLRDCLAMGLSVRSLGKPTQSITGLKEKARRWEVNQAELRAITADDELAKFGPAKIYIMETGKDCPSLLGRDFLDEFGFKLVCDIPNNAVYLEK